MPFGMGKVNIANMTLFKLYQGLGIQKVFQTDTMFCSFHERRSKLEPSFAAKNTVELPDLVNRKQNQG